MGLITAPCVWFGATSKERPLGAGFLAMKERYDGNMPQIGPPKSSTVFSEAVCMRAQAYLD